MYNKRKKSKKAKEAKEGREFFSPSDFFGFQSIN